MHYTPATPDYEAMRDGILAAMANHPSGTGAHRCLVWDAFARYGVGAGANGSIKRGRVTITESFTRPSTCR